MVTNEEGELWRVLAEKKKKTLINREEDHGGSSDFVHQVTTYLGRKVILGLVMRPINY